VGDSVTWTDSIMGGGKVSATKTGTDGTGTASTIWTLGTRAGTQFLRAREASAGLTASFTATATVAFYDVQSGNFQTCGIAALNNTIYCWGLGDAGQLGKGVVSNAAQATVPIPFNGDTLNGPFLQVRQLFPARGYMCALTAARQMYCWGHVVGGSGVTLAAAFTNITDNGNTVIPNLLANGEEHQCVLTLSGQAVCTGFGRQGQIGDGTGLTTTPSTYSLVSTAGGAPTVYSNISAGRSFSCGMGRFNNDTTSHSQVPWCWGFNGSGQIGNGSIANALQPSSVRRPTATTTFDSLTISAGGQHACAIEASTSLTGGLSTAGNAWCWGSNGFGQLGTGTAVPPAGGVERDSVPQAVLMPGVAFMKMYAGEYHSCALTATGVAYCWGRNDYGQTGTTGAASVPVVQPTLVAGNHKFRSLTLGELFTCGVEGVPTASNEPSQIAGTIYCWGDNVYGQLGTTGQASGGSNPTAVPTAVKGQPGHP
jgi:alpha-tubulin suppressor-like RCC1 family protein